MTNFLVFALLIFFKTLFFSRGQDFRKEPPDSLLGRMGGSVRLEWEFEGDTAEFIKWYRTNEQNEPKSNILFLVQGQEPVVSGDYTGRASNPLQAHLSIDQLKESDEGWIACVIDFSGGKTVFSKVFVTVGVAPHDTISDGWVVVKQGETTSLTCRTDAKPAATITWYDSKNQIVKDDSSYTVTEKVEGTAITESKLTIKNILLSQAGKFQCSASNQLGSQLKDSTVIVHYKPINTQLQLQYSIRLEGEENRLTCSCEAVPSPVYYQFYRGTQLLQNTTSTIYAIPVVYNYHQATYACVPRNYVGEGDRKGKLMLVNVAPYVFEKQPETQSVDESSPFTLTCKFYGKPAPEVTWEKQNSANDEPLNVKTETTTSNASLTLVTSQVTLQPAKRADYGSYICVGNNDYGEAKQNVTLQVHYTPKITTHSFKQPSYFVNEGLSDTQTCKAQGLPQPAITWYRENVRISVDSTNHVIENTVEARDADYVDVTSVLTMTKLSKHDTGKLTCRAENVAGFVTETTTLNVFYAPEITAQMDAAVFVNLGSSLSLSCSARSIEHSTITWFKGERRLDSDSLRMKVEETEIGPDFVFSYLTINPVSASDASATYTCVANNSLGEDQRSAVVSVYFGPEITSFPPAKITTHEGTQIYMISCLSQANPKPTVTWFKGDEQAVFNDPQAMYILDEKVVTSSTDSTVINSTVTIPIVNREDYGAWKCRSANQIVGQSSSTEKSTWLSVTCDTQPRKPEDPTDPPEFEFTPSNPYRVNLTSTVIFLCRVKASPKPFVWWNVPVHMNAWEKITTSTFEISDQSEFGSVEAKLVVKDIRKENYGEYRCLTNNTFVMAVRSVKLVVQYPPDVTSSSFDFPGINHIEGTLPYLQVTVDGNPSTKVTWFISRDNGTTYTKLTEILQQSNVAVIKDFENKVQYRYHFTTGAVSRSDQAKYKVKVANILGTKTLETWLRVYWKPEVETIMSRHHNASLGHKMSFICRFHSNPKSRIAWFKGKQPVNEVGYSTAILLTNDSMTLVQSTLTFLHVKIADAADYSCTASNDVGNTTHLQYLNVLYVPQLTPSSQRLLANEGTTLLLSCEAVGNPPVSKYLWMKDNVTIANSNSQSYTIFSVKQNSRGNYTCTPSNSLGQGETITYEVDVTVPPVFTEIPKCTLSTNVYKCQCVGTGYPQPDVFWTKHPSTTKIGAGSLLSFNKSRASDGGYVCHLKSSQGEKTQIVTISDYVEAFGLWSSWGACNATCDEGRKSRVRVCNLPPCSVPLTDSMTCTGECTGDQAGEDEVNWVYALYALIPCVVLLFVVLVVWVTRIQRAMKRVGAIVSQAINLEGLTAEEKKTTITDLFRANPKDQWYNRFKLQKKISVIPLDKRNTQQTRRTQLKSPDIRYVAACRHLENNVTIATTKTNMAYVSERDTVSITSVSDDVASIRSDAAQSSVKWPRLHRVTFLKRDMYLPYYSRDHDVISHDHDVISDGVYESLPGHNRYPDTL